MQGDNSVKWTHRHSIKISTSPFTVNLNKLCMQFTLVVLVHCAHNFTHCQKKPDFWPIRKWLLHNCNYTQDIFLCQLSVSKLNHYNPFSFLKISTEKTDLFFPKLSVQNFWYFPHVWMAVVATNVWQWKSGQIRKMHMWNVLQDTLIS